MKTRSRNDNNNHRKTSRSYLLSLTFLCLSFFSVLSWSGDFQKGLTAAQNGDFATALREWTPLAEQGLSDAQHNLGLMYYNRNDYKTAAKWYTLAAKQGNPNAQINLGRMYGQGHGVPKNYKTAMKWYTLAAEQGDANAQ